MFNCVSVGADESLESLGFDPSKAKIEEPEGHNGPGKAGECARFAHRGGSFLDQVGLISCPQKQRADPSFQRRGKRGGAAKERLLDVFRSVKMIFKWLRRPLTLKPKPQNKKSMRNVSVALLVKLEAKPGKEKEVEAFLRGALPLVQEEPETVAWFAIRMDKSTFGIVDAFPSDEGRQAHLSGKVAAALMAKASELFATPPAIEKVDVLAAKLP